VRTNLGLFQLNTDAMWDLAPHDISIINFLLDDVPLRVSAHGGSFVMREMEINDLVYLHMEYPGGKLANVRVSWLDPNKTRRTTVVGDKKMLVYDDVENLEKLRVYDRGVDATPFTDTYGEFQCSYRYGDVTIPHLSWEEPLRLEVKHFVESVAARTTPRTDGISGLRVVEVLEAAERSIALGRAVDISEVRRAAGRSGGAADERSVGAADERSVGAADERPREQATTTGREGTTRHDVAASGSEGDGAPGSGAGAPAERIEARE
jgi:hypothetical protein